jgi:hypothetical protein
MTEVLITRDPWVGGTRSGYYHIPPLKIERKVSGLSWEEAVDGILDEAAQEARQNGCNAIVGIEITCDPYHSDGGLIRLLGTAARLEPMFGGPFVASSYPNGVLR